MTAGERLHQLAGISGTAAALLLAIGAGATTGAALVDYSGLATGTAAEHLLAEQAAGVWAEAFYTAPEGAGAYRGVWSAARELVDAARRGAADTVVSYTSYSPAVLHVRASSGRRADSEVDAQHSTDPAAEYAAGMFSAKLPRRI